MKRRKYVHNFIIKNKEEQTLSNKQIKSLVETHLIKYKKCKLQLECFDAISLVNNTSNVLKEELITYIDLIEKVLSSLTAISKEILNEEYLKANKNDNWWENKYSRSTFFKLKQVALKEFYVYIS